MLCVSNVSLTNPNRLFLTGITIAVLFHLVGCERKVTKELPEPDEQTVAIDFTAETNNIAGIPGMVYSAAEKSPIHWQPWTKESQEMARKSRRLMLVVIAIPQQPTYSNILAQLASDPATVAEINRSYVPILVDGDAVREFGILTAELCSEIGSGLQLPLVVWMTPQCDPVAWIPLPSRDSGSAVELFNQSHGMVGNMWQEDPGYVTKNSRMDQVNRSARMRKRMQEREISKEPAADCLRALRQLTSLYDPVSRTFDEAGGLFPCGALDLLTMGARMEGIPDDLHEKCKQTLGFLLDDLLVSAMFDPLDGGVFNARRGATWSLPGFHRDCATQARVAISLLDAYEVTHNAKALERALGILGFAEKTYRNQDGLFALGGGNYGAVEEWLWRYEDVQGWLSEEELSAWVLASGMAMPGNLPSEVDPLREFFRANSISFSKTTEQVAAELGADAGTIRDTLDRAREKLLKVRNARLSQAPENRYGSAAATFRIVSAYATAYRITGKLEFRDLAVSTLEKAKKSFSDGPRLNSHKSDAPASLNAARAFVYGLAIQASLDVAAVTLDESWNNWAGDLASTASEIFVQDDTLRECPSYADLVGMPVVDLAMLFDDSSVGLLAMADSRLDALGIPFVPSFAKKVSGLPINSLDSPILHTDVIQASLVRYFGITCVYGADAAPDLKHAIAASPLKGVSRRSSPAGSGGSDQQGALIIGPGKESRRALTAEDIPVPSLP